MALPHTICISVIGPPPRLRLSRPVLGVASKIAPNFQNRESVNLPIVVGVVRVLKYFVLTIPSINIYFIVYLKSNRKSKASENV